MSPWALWTAATACATVTPGFRRTRPQVGPLALGPLGAVPVNVETTLTAPDTSLPDTDTPVVPLSAMLSVGSVDAALAAVTPPASPTTHAATTLQETTNDLNRLTTELL